MILGDSNGYVHVFPKNFRESYSFKSHTSVSFLELSIENNLLISLGVSLANERQNVRRSNISCRLTNQLTRHRSSESGTSTNWTNLCQPVYEQSKLIFRSQPPSAYLRMANAWQLDSNEETFPSTKATLLAISQRTLKIWFSARHRFGELRSSKWERRRTSFSAPTRAFSCTRFRVATRSSSRLSTSRRETCWQPAAGFRPDTTMDISWSGEMMRFIATLPTVALLAMRLMVGRF